MEPLKQFLKIGTGLAAVIGVAFLALPERPTLLAGGVDVRAEAPVAARPEAPAAESDPTPVVEQTDADDEEAEASDEAADTELAGASEAAPAAAVPEQPPIPTEDETEIARAEAPLPDIAPEPVATPTAGQAHLERLRGENAAATEPPTDEPLADPAPAETAPSEIPPADIAVEPAPAEEPVSGPSAAEFAFGEALPQDGPPADDFAAPAEMPEEDFAVPDEPSAGGGSGLASLTGPAEPPQFRLLPAPEATDSGTILAGNQAIRLSGIVAVPSEAVCADGAACGTQAREAVQSWLAGRAVLCAVPSGAANEAVAPCLMGEEDVGEWIVANGWAEAEPGSRYTEAQERARADGRGIWASGGR